ncbi:uncharacterized protein YxeA [Clostridium beijerinckii]|uniref:Uncharacterized protein YxeA n=1 Tax=Clostridium beijerinckii TaxID=1520 RepID=A0AAX0AVC8_CLOBE|nr:uncharacterized protein YxeA [Clostridium beijerinckii]NRT87010.1 uncharacterized protein YxeA [Clostridium beijerinckii]NYC02020.1 uncharacterized protein YxeA [Clostridium beijerinckii]NYC72443.1 uncharacterized protein YxeA [Clostridium beijerinckii]
MEIVVGVIFVLIMIIIGMIFGRSIQFIGIIVNGIVKFKKNYFKRSKC